VSEELCIFIVESPDFMLEVSVIVEAGLSTVVVVVEEVESVLEASPAELLHAAKAPIAKIKKIFFILICLILNEYVWG
jgi:hypothetical protein